MKKLLGIILSVLIAVSLFGCAKTEETPVETNDTSYYPVTVTDTLNREVIIESEPQKIVSGYYISTSTIIALGLKDKLVGIEAKANKRPIYSLSAPELIDLPNVGSAKEFDLEGCIALEPDLVILPKKLKDAAETMSELGIKVLLVNPEDGALLEEMINMICKATNKEENGKNLIAFSDRYEEFLTEKNKGTDTPKVYLAGNSDVLTTAGPAMFQNTMLEQAGLENVASDITDTYWASISYEQLLAYNPEYIIIASEADYEAEDVLNNEDLAMLDAVKEGKVVKLPSETESWDSPVASSILGSLWLCSYVKPDVLSMDECYTIIEEYYETFYGFTYPSK